MFYLHDFLLQMRIVDVSSRWAGSSHDATIFNNSAICEKLDRGDYGIDAVVLGDSAYAPLRYMCKPLPQPRTVSEEAYQRAQITTRNAAERGFGILKRRFPCLMLGMRFKLEKVQDVIVACCVLHNFLTMQNELAIPMHQDEIDRQMEIGEQLIAAQQEARAEIPNHRFLIENYF